MGTRELESAMKRGEPLIEITVIFCADVYPPAATKRLNDLAEDLHVGTTSTVRERDRPQKPRLSDYFDGNSGAFLILGCRVFTGGKR
jgi:hypothetical protein